MNDAQFTAALEALRPEIEPASAEAKASIGVAADVVFRAVALVAKSCCQSMKDEDLVALKAFLRGMAMTCQGTCDDIDAILAESKGLCVQNSPSSWTVQ